MVSVTVLPSAARVAATLAGSASAPTIRIPAAAAPASTCPDPQHGSHTLAPTGSHAAMTCRHPVGAAAGPEQGRMLRRRARIANPRQESSSPCSTLANTVRAFQMRDGLKAVEAAAAVLDRHDIRAAAAQAVAEVEHSGSPSTIRRGRSAGRGRFQRTKTWDGGPHFLKAKAGPANPQRRCRQRNCATSGARIPTPRMTRRCGRAWTGSRPLARLCPGGRCVQRFAGNGKPGWPSLHRRPRRPPIRRSRTVLLGRWRLRTRRRRRCTCARWRSFARRSKRTPSTRSP